MQTGGKIPADVCIKVEKKLAELGEAQCADVVESQTYATYRHEWDDVRVVNLSYRFEQTEEDPSKLQFHRKYQLDART